MSETVAYRLEAPREALDRLSAELHSRGTLGIEEREAGDDRVLLLAYFAQAADLRALEGDGVRVHGPEAVPEADWETEWRRGLAPRQVAGLWIRPSWCASQGRPELVIDPQQAFGSGEHATTRLSLALLLEGVRAGERVLDVGTGSGILGLAALRAGAGSALGIEIDPVACRNAAENRARNALPLRLACATPAALRPAERFDVVVCNMLLSRFAPLVDDLSRRTRRRLLLSGYLRGERGRVDALCTATGLRTLEEREESQSGDVWCARVLAHAADRQ